MSSPYPTLLFVFDFDGVLVDSSTSFLDMLRRVHAEMKMPVEVPEDLWDRLEEISFRSILDFLEVPAARRSAYADRMVAWMTSEAYRPPLFSGVDGVLRALAKAGPVAVLSATPTDVIEAVLCRGGLSDVVDQVHDGRKGVGKAVQLAGMLESYRVEPRRAVMIGDALSDIRAGQANGMRTAAVSWGWQRVDRLRAAGPDWVFERVEELRDLPTRVTAMGESGQ